MSYKSTASDFPTPMWLITDLDIEYIKKPRSGRILLRGKQLTNLKLSYCLTLELLVLVALPLLLELAEDALLAELLLLEVGAFATVL